MSKMLQVLIGAMPLYVVRFSIGGIPTNAFEVAVIATFLFGVFRPAIRSEWFRTARSMRPMVVCAVLVFLLSACAATAVSHEVRVSLGILKGWVVIPALFGYMIASAIHSSRISLQKSIYALALSGTAVAWIGIVQIGALGRVRSLYDVPNSLALFLLPILIIALYTGMQARNTFLIFCGMSMMLAACATGSLGAFLALIGVGILIFFRVRLRNTARLMAVLVAFLGLAAVFIGPRIPYLISPLTHVGATNSATVRLQLWDVAGRLVMQHPVFGVGLGQFEPAYQVELHRLFELSSRGVQATSYVLQPEYVFRDPHNWVLSFWLNLGIVGLLSFCYINWQAIKRGVMSAIIERRALAFGLIGMLLYGLVDTIYWKNDLAALWWLIAIYSAI